MESVPGANGANIDAIYSDGVLSASHSEQALTLSEQELVVEVACFLSTYVQDLYALTLN